ncbi:unnamed protein product [Malus baccata var. baccata]
MPKRRKTKLPIALLERLLSRMGSHTDEESIASAKRHIKEIRTKKYSIGKKQANPLTLDLHHAVTSLSAELYQKDIHFLMELIQNAEDNEYEEGVEPTLEFVMTKRDITGSGAPATLLVFNNEVGFSRKNMDSICSVGCSTKKGKRQQGFIGEKGIGFKSGFLVSSQPWIFSNGICNAYGSNKILPTTIFVLPLKPDKVEAVRAQLSDLHPKILLFLSKIKRLYVRGFDSGKADDVSTISIFSETEHMDLGDERANSRVVQLSYYLWRESFPVKPGNRVSVRMDVEEWVITLAFPFGERLRRGTSSVVRVLPKFRDIVVRIRSQGAVLCELSSFLMHSSLDLDKYNEVLDFLRVESAGGSWYGKYIKSCNLVLLSDEVYIDILDFIADNKKFSKSIKTIPLLKYINREGNMELCTVAKGTVEAPQLRYATKLELHTWLSKCNMEFGCPDNVYFLPSSTQKALVNHCIKMKKPNLTGSSSLSNWLHDHAGVKSCSAYDYAILLSNHVFEKEQNLAFPLAIFLHHSHKKCFLTDYNISDLGSWIPIIDGAGHVSRERTETLVPASGSKWVKLFGPKNPFVEQKYVDIGDVYAKSSMFLGESTTEKELLDFVVKISKAVDLPELCPPDAVLQVASHELGRSVVDDEWLAVMKGKKWLKTHRGYSSSGSSILLQSEIEAEICLKLTNLPIVDEAFYGSRLGSFLPELRCLGSEASGLIKQIQCQPWIKTTVGFKCPSETVLPDPRWGCLFSILQVPAIDVLYYGNAIWNFNKELNAMGVVVDSPGTIKMFADQFNSLLSSSGLAAANVMSLLGCIRELRQTMQLQCSELEWLLSEKWLKTRHGYKTPAESIIFNSKWGSISSFIDLPLIDDVYYGIGIYKFKDELQMLGVISDFEQGAPLVAKGLHSPIDAELLTTDGILSLLECIKYLMLFSLDDPQLGEFLMTVGKSRWLKTMNGYNTPEDCILFDRSWESILNRSDGPIIDETFYGTKISVYKDQLEFIGVKIDLFDVCDLLSENVLSLTDTAAITRVYSFLNKFRWRPKVIDKCNSQLWIPNPKSTGLWAKSQDCVLHDTKNLFSSCLFSLDKFYNKELLPLFSSAYGVALNPSFSHYLQLWSTWALRGNSQVTVVECSSFWEYVAANWNQQLRDTLKQKLTKVPATMSGLEKIHLIRREEVFIADDLRLKKIFSGCDKVPLFVWFPKSYSLSYIYPGRLQAIYESLGVRKISDSVKCKVNGVESLEHWEKIDARNGLIGRGLVKIILAFLAGPEVNMSLYNRHEAANSVIMLSVYKSDKPIQVCYRLMPSAATTVEVKKQKLVLWEKDSQRLLIDKSGYEGRRNDLEFVTSFAIELAQELLAAAKPTAADKLSKLIQMGFMFDFSEGEVDFLLMNENLELFVEDEQFLNAAFDTSGELGRVYEKRSGTKLEQLGPSTSMPLCKKQRQ